MSLYILRCPECGRMAGFKDGTLHGNSVIVCQKCFAAIPKIKD